MKGTNKNLVTFVISSKKITSMKTVAHLTTDITLTFNQVAELARQLPKSDRLRLVTLLQKYDEPTKEQLLQDLREAIDEVNLAKEGKVKLKSARDFIDEL
ncbi:hypothetical protein [Runella slithyformis]|nr:hypothetical protein [Runella slithyformis]